MLILLPPSEGKSPGGDGPPVGRRPVLSTPALTRPRADLLAALRRAARADPDGLAKGLRFPASVAAAAVAATAAASSSPTMAALDRYGGVVYQALDVTTLTGAARRRAEEQVCVVSGLWGLVRASDFVPDYRVPAAGQVPGLGGVTAHWRAALAAAMPEIIGDNSVLDLRSTDYLAMWRPVAGTTANGHPPAGRTRAAGTQAARTQAARTQDVRTLVVRVLAERETAAGLRTAPVNFHAKTVKGQVVRHLVSTRRRFTDPMAALSDAAAALDLRVVETSRGDAWSADLIGRYPC